MTRVNEIFTTLGSHNQLPGANGIEAEEHAKTFRMAWDFAGSALGSRSELYERFYLSSQPRNLSGNHMLARIGREWTDVDDFRRISGIA